MPGAGNAPKGWLSGFAAVLVLLLALASPASAAKTATATIDFSEHGPGLFDQSYFSAAGFSQGSWVGYIQGDESLVAPVEGTADDKFTSISASVAPATQGTADYTLTALDNSGRTISSKTVRVTQDTGDPETGPWGYVTIELGPLSKKASSFHISNSFIRSSHSHITQIEFGVASIALSR
jgi:hypothetical protein